MGIGEHVEEFAGFPVQNYDPAQGIPLRSIRNREASLQEPEAPDEHDRYVAHSE